MSYRMDDLDAGDMENLVSGAGIDAVSKYINGTGMASQSAVEQLRGQELFRPPEGLARWALTKRQRRIEAHRRALEAKDEQP